MRRILLMVALVVAGELVFGLAFNVPRFFRPTMLEVFGISNTELGDMFALYGVAAMLSYFPGGAVADRYSARALITFSLLASSAGGLVMATIPGPTVMRLLYAYWGVMTIFPLWGPLIRATRNWGGGNSQGIAFGILDGGRGLVAAAAAALSVTLLAMYLPDNARLSSPEEREAGFRAVVLFYTALTFLAGVLTWIAIPDEQHPAGRVANPFKGMAVVLRRPIVWALAGVIVCAYCTYKGLDNYSLYAVQVLGLDEVEGARLASYGVWVRPIAAVAAGLIADRFNATHAIIATFAMLCAAYFGIAMMSPENVGLSVIYANFLVTFAGVYALRGIYYAVLEENATPMHLTGAAVGLVSLIGYTPDIFFGPISGRILDASPGLPGFRHYFVFLAAIAAVGIVCSLFMIWLRRHGSDRIWGSAATAEN